MSLGPVISLAHLRARRRLDLLALDALDGRELADTLAHVEACARCRQDLSEARAMLEALRRDPARAAEPDLPVQFMVARVQARLEQALTSRRALTGWRLLGLACAATAVLAAIAVIPRLVPEPPVEVPVASSAASAVPVVSEAALVRLERTLAREQAARYLSDAQDLLVTVAAATRDCERDGRRVDVSEETERSRELLARRALLLESEGGEVASVRPVLDDVERVLREVALLESCARRRDLEAINREVGRRDLLLKIGLMTRELQG